MRMSNTKLGSDPDAIVLDRNHEAHRIGDLAKRSDKLGDIARLVLATGRVDCPGCNKRRRATHAFYEPEGKPPVWLCIHCHTAFQGNSQKQQKAIDANIERYLGG